MKRFSTIWTLVLNAHAAMVLTKMYLNSTECTNEVYSARAVETKNGEYCAGADKTVPACYIYNSQLLAEAVCVNESISMQAPTFFKGKYLEIDYYGNSSCTNLEQVYFQSLGQCAKDEFSEMYIEYKLLPSSAVQRLYYKDSDCNFALEDSYTFVANGKCVTSADYNYLAFIRDGNYTSKTNTATGGLMATTSSNQLPSAGPMSSLSGSSSSGQSSQAFEDATFTNGFLTATTSSNQLPSAGPMSSLSGSSSSGQSSQAFEDATLSSYFSTTHSIVHQSLATSELSVLYTAGLNGTVYFMGSDEIYESTSTLIQESTRAAATSLISIASTASRRISTSIMPTIVESAVLISSVSSSKTSMRTFSTSEITLKVSTVASTNENSNTLVAVTATRPSLPLTTRTVSSTYSYRTSSTYVVTTYSASSSAFSSSPASSQMSTKKDLTKIPTLVQEKIGNGTFPTNPTDTSLPAYAIGLITLAAVCTFSALIILFIRLRKMKRSE
jgi:hypothetical protein